VQRPILALALAMAASVAGCGNDYKLDDDLDPERPGLTTSTTPSGDGDDDDDGPWTGDTDPVPDGDDDDDGGWGDDDDDDAAGDDDDDDLGDDDDDDTPYRDRDDPPDEWEDEDCPDGVLATWHGGELAVLGGDLPKSGDLDVPVAGLYDVYDLAIAESGPSQTNESAFLRVPNSWDPEGKPSPLGLSNCDGDYVALDSDNVSPPAAGTTQYLGTFYFDAGMNEVQLHHYCSLYRDGLCPSLHDAGTPCDGINSVHFLGEAVCLVEVR